MFINACEYECTGISYFIKHDFCFQVVKPRALHKTSSIFLRNLAPTITKDEIEHVSVLNKLCFNYCDGRTTPFQLCNLIYLFYSRFVKSSPAFYG